MREKSAEKSETRMKLCFTLVLLSSLACLWRKVLESWPRPSSVNFRGKYYYTSKGAPLPLALCGDHFSYLPAKASHTLTEEVPTYVYNYIATLGVEVKIQLRSVGR